MNFVSRSVIPGSAARERGNGRLDGLVRGQCRRGVGKRSDWTGLTLPEPALLCCFLIGPMRSVFPTH